MVPGKVREPAARGVMKATKGDTGATPNLYGHKEFFRRRDADQKKVLEVPWTRE
jgi:hypothetical protein